MTTTTVSVNGRVYRCVSCSLCGDYASVQPSALAWLAVRHAERAGWQETSDGWLCSYCQPARQGA